MRRPATAPVGRRPTRTFVSLTGPAGNIGDALIRRETLRWARGTSDELIAYTGDAPDVWLRQLGIPTGTRVLRGKRSVTKWLWLIASSPRRPVLVFEAGEVPLGPGNGLRELVFLAETIIVRLKGGVVVRPPRGIRGTSRPALWLHARAARASQIALWRDATSAGLAGGSRVAPDIGFAAGIRPAPAAGERTDMLVSLRGNRPMPDGAWIDAVRSVAEQHGLRVRAIVQVREDEDRARELAHALGGETELWGDRDPLAHEAVLRDGYDRARLVLSDRMHVLVLAALSGAVPVEAVPNPTGKIAEAFHTIGYDDLSVDVANAGSDTIAAFLSTQLSRTGELAARVSNAADELDDLEAVARGAIEAARA